MMLCRLKGSLQIDRLAVHGFSQPAHIQALTSSGHGACDVDQYQRKRLSYLAGSRTGRLCAASSA